MPNIVFIKNKIQIFSIYRNIFSQNTTTFVFLSSKITKNVRKQELSASYGVFRDFQ